jgi:circadian clock protein KaiC
MASEQSSDEVIRNMRSIGIDLEPWIKRGLLRFYASRPGAFGLEKHLLTIHDLAAAFAPHVVVIDPITNFESVGTHSEVKSMVTRLIDVFKSRQITAMFTSLTSGDSAEEISEVGVSSQMDTWLLLRNLEGNGERNRGLYVLKSRGMAHSNQIREFVLTDNGVQLHDVYVGPSGLLTGSARVAQEARERAEELQRKQQLERKNLDLRQKRQKLEADIARMREEFKAEEQELARDARLMESHEKQLTLDRREMAQARSADVVPVHSNGRA